MFVSLVIRTKILFQTSYHGGEEDVRVKVYTTYFFQVHAVTSYCASVCDWLYIYPQSATSFVLMSFSRSPKPQDRVVRTRKW